MNNSLMNMRYQASITQALELAKKWRDKAPDNQEVQDLANCLIDVSIYNAGLEMERREFSMLVSELRSDKNRAILRARKAEETIEPLQNRLNKVEQSLKAFTQ
tara:strand:- start:56 stop:364 length:309 start_codon:yes stop_codon:yes gene_type:complete